MIMIKMIDPIMMRKMVVMKVMKVMPIPSVVMCITLKYGEIGGSEAERAAGPLSRAGEAGAGLTQFQCQWKSILWGWWGECVGWGFGKYLGF